MTDSPKPTGIAPGPWEAMVDHRGGWYVRAADGTVVAVGMTKAVAEFVAAGPNLLEALKAIGIPDYPLSDCPANRGYILAQRAIAEAEGASYLGG